MSLTTLAFVGLTTIPSFTTGVAASILKLLPLLRESTTLCASLHANVSIIKEKDMKFRLLNIETLLQTIEKNKFLHDDRLVQVAVEGVHEIVEAMNKQLQSLDKIVQEHSQKWISGWRSLDITGPVDELAALDPILDKRCDILLKNISICCEVMESVKTQNL
jgi:hypothetical protein